MSEHLYCTFHVAGQFYGIPVEDVREVIMNQSRTPVPLAPPAVLGMMNIRGRIVSAIDMRTVLRLPDTGRPQEPVHLIVRHQGEEVGLVVDRIGDVLERDPGTREAPPETLGQTERNFIHGVFQLEDRLLLVLDIHRVLEDQRCTRAVSAEQNADPSIHSLH